MRLYYVNESFGCKMIEHFIEQHGGAVLPDETIRFPVDSEEAEFETTLGKITVFYF